MDPRWKWRLVAWLWAGGKTLTGPALEPDACEPKWHTAIRLRAHATHYISMQVSCMLLAGSGNPTHPPCNDANAQAQLHRCDGMDATTAICLR